MSPVRPEAAVNQDARQFGAYRLASARTETTMQGENSILIWSNSSERRRLSAKQVSGGQTRACRWAHALKTRFIAPADRFDQSASATAKKQIQPSMMARR
jgi:hypothetical protein